MSLSELPNETTMAKALKISDSEYEVLREAATVNSRSLSGQLEHWVRIGRAVERDPSIAYSRIEQALRGLVSPDELTAGEQDEFFDEFSRRMAVPSERETAIYGAMKDGAGDEDDSLVYGTGH
jgi:hypothetical protein